MLYEYKCSSAACGHVFEVQKRVAEVDREEACPKCQASPATRHYAGKAPPVHFKGGGWFVKDYKRPNPGNK